MSIPGANPTHGEDAINWRNLIAACAAVCVFSFSLGEMFPLHSLNMESWGVSEAVIGMKSKTAFFERFLCRNG